jgi:hypothetical protein
MQAERGVERLGKRVKRRIEKILLNPLAHNKGYTYLSSASSIATRASHLHNHPLPRLDIEDILYPATRRMPALGMIDKN